MTGKLRKTLLTLAACLGLLLGGLAFGLVPINLFFIKPILVQWVAEETGLQLQIDGPLRARLGPSTHLSASGLSLQGMTGAPPLLQLERLAIDFRLLKWLRDETLQVERIFISELQADYCPAPGWNSEFGAPEPDGATALPEIVLDALVVEHLRPACSQGDHTLPWLPSGIRLEASAARQRPVEIHIQSLDDENRMSLSATSSTLETLLSGSDSLPLELELSAFEAELTASGILTGPAENAGFKGTLEFSTEHLSALGARFAMDMQGFSAVSLRSGMELDQRQLNAYGLTGSLDGTPFSGSLRIQDYLSTPQIEMDGQADLEGISLQANARFDSNLPCPQLTAEVQAHNTDLETLFALFDRKPVLRGTTGPVSINSQSCGDHLEAHLESLEAEVSVESFVPDLGGSERPLVINSATGFVAWGRPGELRIDGHLKEEAFRSHLTFDPIGDIKRERSSRMTLALQGAGASLNANGQVAVQGDAPALNIELSTRSDRLGSLRRWLAVPENLDLPFEGSGHLLFSHEGLEINRINVMLGQTDVRGTVRWEGPESAKPMQLSLQSNNTAADELEQLFAARRPPETAVPEGGPQQSRLSNSNRRIDEWLKLPNLAANIEIGAVSGLDSEVRNLDLSFKLNHRLIDDARLSATVEGIEFNGLLDADLRQRPWVVTFESSLENVDIGHLLDKLARTPGVDAHAASAWFRLESEGSSLQGLVDNTEARAEVSEVRWLFSIGPENDAYDARLGTLTLQASPGSMLEGEAQGTLNGVAMHAFAQLPSLRGLAETSAPVPVKLAMQTRDDLLLIDAFLRRQPDGRHKGHIAISGEQASQANTRLSALVSPLADFAIDSKFVISEDRLHLPDLSVSIGSSGLSGELDIRYLNPAFQLVAHFKSPFVQTDDLVSFTNEWRESREAIRSPSDKQVQAPDTGQGFMALFTRAVDDIVSSNRLDIRVEVDELWAGSSLLGETLVVAQADGDDFSIDPVKMVTPDGTVEASYLGRREATGYEVDLDIYIPGLEYGGLLRLLDSNSEVDGRLYLDTHLRSRYSDGASLTQHLDGKLDMMVIPENVPADFLDLWASNLIFALLPGSGNSKKMNCMVARFEVENGVMHSKTTFLDSTEVIVRARGHIDLANETIHLRVAPQAKREKFFSVSAPVEVSGPLSDFKVEVAPGGFINTMFRWYYGLIYVPWKWLTGERFPAEGLATCQKAMEMD